MKKAYFAVLLLFILVTANAQVSPFEIGIEGGPNVSQYQKYPPNPPSNAGFTVSYSPLYSFSAGLTGQFNLNRIISLKSGLIYGEKGVISNETVTNNSSTSPQTTKFTGKTDYLVLPFLGKFGFGKKVKFFFNGGFYLGLRLSSTKIDLSQYGSPNSTTVDAYHQFDFGTCFGIGAESEIGKNLSIDLEARNDLGLISTSKLEESKNYDQNISYDLLVGLSYRLANKK